MGAPTPGARGLPGVTVGGLLLFDVAWAQRAQGQAGALRPSPPAASRQGTAPPHGLSFVEHHALALPCPGLECGPFQTGRGQGGGGGCELAGGPTRAQRVFLTPRARCHGGTLATTPLRMDGALRQGGLLNETIELPFEFTGQLSRPA